MCVIKMISLLLGFSAIGIYSEGISTCDGGNPETGSSMLQLSRSPKVRLQMEGAGDHELDYPMTEDGWNAANGACCLLEVDIFLRDFIPSLQLELCDEGSLNGILPFFSCNSNITFSILKEYLFNASSTSCPWLMPKGACKALPESCMLGEYNATAHRRRACRTTTTKSPIDLLCCKKVVPAFQNAQLQFRSNYQPQRSASKTQPQRSTSKPTMHRRLFVKAAASRVHQSPDPEITKVAPINCETQKLPIQILSQGENDENGALTEPYYAKQLIIETGEYETLFKIPFERTSPPLNRLNSCGINPLDSIIYCATTTSEPDKKHYIVRVDKDKFEFVAKIPARGFSGTFSASGTYYWGGESKLWFVTGLNTFKGYPKQDDVGLKDLLNMVAFIPAPEQTDLRLGMDLVAVTGVDLDDSGDDAEYLVSLHAGWGSEKPTVTFTKAKLDTGFVKTWWNEVTFIDADPKGGFGAAWNYNGRLYFTHNAGSGVYEVNVDQLSSAEGAAPVKVKKVGISAKTGWNDGLNCIFVDPPPFPEPGDCEFGFEEVEPVGGACPEGSIETERIE